MKQLRIVNEKVGDSRAKETQMSSIRKLNGLLKKSKTF